MATKKPAKSAVPAKLQLPTKFDAFKAELGTNRKAMKICVFGPPDSGKSFMAASAPSPKVVIDTGEGGISYELDPASGDQLLRIADAPVVKVDSTGKRPPAPTAANTIVDLLKACLVEAEAGRLKTVVIDSYTLLRKNHIDRWQDHLGRDPQFQDWKKIKDPIKEIDLLLMAMPCHVIVTGWQKTATMVTETVKRGVGNQEITEVRERNMPDLDLRTGHTFDVTFRTDVERHKDGTPTGKHTVTFYGGRRPRTVDPKSLYPGKSWSFNSKAPKNVWDTLIAPLAEKWEENGVETVGPVDLEERDKYMEQLRDEAIERGVGEIVAEMLKMDSQEDLGQLWRTKVTPGWNGLTQQQQQTLSSIKDVMKERLAA